MNPHVFRATALGIPRCPNRNSPCGAVSTSGSSKFSRQCSELNKKLNQSLIEFQLDCRTDFNMIQPFKPINI